MSKVFNREQWLHGVLTEDLRPGAWGFDGLCGNCRGTGRIDGDGRACKASDGAECPQCNGRGWKP